MGIDLQEGTFVFLHLLDQCISLGNGLEESVVDHFFQKQKRCRADNTLASISGLLGITIQLLRKKDLELHSRDGVEIHAINLVVDATNDFLNKRSGIVRILTAFSFFGCVIGLLYQFSAQSQWRAGVDRQRELLLLDLLFFGNQSCFFLLNLFSFQAQIAAGAPEFLLTGFKVCFGLFQSGDNSSTIHSDASELLLDLHNLCFHGLELCSGSVVVSCCDFGLLLFHNGLHIDHQLVNGGNAHHGLDRVFNLVKGFVIGDLCDLFIIKEEEPGDAEGDDLFNIEIPVVRKVLIGQSIFDNSQFFCDLAIVQGPSALDLQNGRTVIFKVDGNGNCSPGIRGGLVDKASHQIVVILDFVLDQGQSPLSVECDEHCIQDGRLTAAIHAAHQCDVFVGQLIQLKDMITSIDTEVMQFYSFKNHIASSGRYSVSSIPSSGSSTSSSSPTLRRRRRAISNASSSSL